MKEGAFLSIILLLLLAITSFASPLNKASAIIKNPLPDLQGETLTYSVMLNKISLGKQELKVESIINYKGRPTYVVNFAGIPNIMLKALNYKSSEVYYLDQATLLPFFISRDYGAGFAEGHMEASYLVEENVINVVVNEGNKEQKYSWSALEAFQGETSIVFFSRFIDLKAKPKVALISNVGIKYIQLEAGKTEKIKVPAGEFNADTVIINPDLGKVWLTKDRYRIPLKIVLNLNAGLLEMKLQSILR